MLAIGLGVSIEEIVGVLIVVSFQYSSRRAWCSEGVVGVAG